MQFYRILLNVKIRALKNFPLHSNEMSVLLNKEHIVSILKLHGETKYIFLANFPITYTRSLLLCL
jgi:hypothetical protein